MSTRRVRTLPPATSRSGWPTSADCRKIDGLRAAPPLDPAAAELASIALGRRVFALLLGAAFAVSAGLCIYASQWADAWLSFRTAVQISGWLCILAVLAGFCARVARNRRDLGEVSAAATGFFTG